MELEPLARRTALAVAVARESLSHLRCGACSRRKIRFRTRAPLAVAIAAVLPMSSVSAQSCSPSAAGQVAADACTANVAGGSFDTGSAILTPAFVATNGGVINASGTLQLATGGTYSFGAQATAAGTIVFSGGTFGVTTIADGAFGLHSSGAGSLIRAQDIAMQTSGGTFGSVTSTGVVAEFGGLVELSGGSAGSSVITTGAGAFGLLSQGGATLSADGSATPVTVTTSGDGAIGAYAFSGATMTLTGVQVTTAGASAAAAQSTGSQLNLFGGRYVTAGANSAGVRADNGAISIARTTSGIGIALETTGIGSHGMVAVNGGDIVADGVTVTVHGQDSAGLVADGAGSTLVASDIAVFGRDFGAYGVGALNGGAITLNGGTVESVNSALRTGAGGTINATDMTLTATGGNAIGVLADNGTIQLVRGSVTANVGSTDHGLLASGSSGRVTAQGTTVTASGDGLRVGDGSAEFTGGSITSVGNGVRTAGGGQVIVADSTVTVSGDGAYGLLSVSDDSLLQATSVLVSTSGLNADGAHTNSGGAMRVTGGTLDTSGGGAFGAHAMADSRIELFSTQVVTIGDGSYGLGASGTGAQLVATGVDVRTAGLIDGASGTRASGAVAEFGGRLKLHGGDGVVIQTSGANGIGLESRSSGGPLPETLLLADAGGSSIRVITTGTDAPGALVDASADAPARMQLTGVAIDTLSQGSFGVFALGAGATLQVAGGSIVTAGFNAPAVVTNAGTVSLTRDGAGTGTSISTAGDFGHGLLATNAGSISADGATLSTTGTVARGVQADGGALVQLQSTSITTGGAGAYGALAVGAGTRIVASGVNVRTTGETFGTSTSSGVVAEFGGSVQLGGTSTVSTQGADAYGLLAQGAGASLVADAASGPIDVATTGEFASGARVFAGASMTLSGVGVSTTGVSAEAAEVLGADARLDIVGGRYATSGERAAGVLADGGLVTIRAGRNGADAVVDASGFFSHGLHAIAGGRIDAGGVAVATHHDASRGALAEAGSVITLTDATISTDGNISAGVTANGDGATLTATRVDVTTRGGPLGASAAVGVLAEFGAQLSHSGGSITTLGENGVAALAQVGEAATRDTIASFDDVTIRTSGTLAHGTEACSLVTGSAPCTSPPGADVAGVGARALLTIAASDIATQGAQAFGLQAYGDNAELQAREVSVATSGSQAHAAVVRNGGSLSLADGTLSAQGDGASGVYMTAPAGVAGTVLIERSVVGSVAGASIRIEGGSADVTFNDSQAVENNGLWLQVGAADATTARVRVDPSEVRGAAVTGVGSTTDLTLQQSLWTLTGNSNVTSLVLDGGLIDFAAPAGGGFRTLTAVDFTGQGGTLALNTFLAGDDSPSDRLVIDGGQGVGNAWLRIDNAGGLGEATQADGIVVVDAVAATTSPGLFALAAPVVAGPYEYLLYRGGTQSDSASDWFLRSTIDCTEPGAPVPPCPAPPDPGPSPDPTPDPDPDPPMPSPFPHFRQEVSLAAALPAMALVYGRTLVDTLHERVGEEATLREAASHAGPSGMWVRALAHDGRRDSDRLGIYGSQGPQFDYDFQALQVGMDLYRSARDDGRRDHAGAWLAYGRGEGEVRHHLLDLLEFHAGRDEFKAQSVSLYWTRFGARDAYLDAVLQATRYDLAARSTRLPVAKTDGWGWVASLEGGWPFALGARGAWKIEPQAQLLYGILDLDDLHEVAARVRFDDARSLVARAGARLLREGESAARDGRPRVSTFWLRANAWHEFEGEPRAEFPTQSGFIAFPADLGGSWGEVGVGATLQVGDALHVFGDLDWTSSFDGDDRAWNAKLGVRWHW